MNVRIVCTVCHKSLDVADTLLGKTVQCPYCTAAFLAQATAATDERPIPPPPSRPVAGGGGAIVSTAPGAASLTRPGRRGWVGPVLLLVGVAGLGALGVWGLTSLFGGNGTGSWAEFTSAEGCFTVILPGTPEYAKKTDPRLAEGSLPIHEYVAKDGRGQVTYSVQYFDLWEQPINNYLYLRHLERRDAASFSGGKVGGERNITWRKHGGREYTVELPEQKAVIRRAYVVEHRVFLLSVAGPASIKAAPETSRFFGSFTVTTTPPPPRPRTQGPSVALARASG